MRAQHAPRRSRRAVETPKRPNTGSETGARDAGAQPRRKFKNIPTEVDGYRFDSRKEADRYATLRMLERAGEIRDLEVHPRFPLVIHGEDCGVYVSDFAWIGADGSRHVEDVKSPATRKLPTYRLKVRMVWALYGLRVEER